MYVRSCIGTQSTKSVKYKCLLVEECGFISQSQSPCKISRNTGHSRTTEHPGREGLLSQKAAELSCMEAISLPQRCYLISRGRAAALTRWLGLSTVWRKGQTKDTTQLTQRTVASRETWTQLERENTARGIQRNGCIQNTADKIFTLKYNFFKVIHHRYNITEAFQNFVRHQ